jgi:phosphate uptake regulator
MSNLNNPKNVIGMAELFADDDEDVNIDDIEKSITTGITSKRKEPQPVDIAKEYSKEIDDLGRRFGVSASRSKPSSISVEDESEDTRTIDDLLNWSPYQKPTMPTKLPVKMASRDVPRSAPPPRAPYNLTGDDDENTNDDDESPTIDMSAAAANYYPNSTARPAWSATLPQDEQLSRMTDEERKQEHLNKVLGNIERNTDDNTFIQQEDEEDEMAKIIEKINLLRTNLTNEGVSLEGLTEITANSSKREARSALKVLEIKNDRLRYCDFFEEGILAVAYGLEGVFNGNREIFGSKIDLTGYSDTVKVKLRRMRYDTSNFVSSVMQGYNISSGWRIVLELIPSLFLYSRDRRLKANDNLISDDAYKKAMQDLS